jgi:hypothetical protein
LEDPVRGAARGDFIVRPERIANREKLILAGLYLSKYDSDGLRKLGFRTFLEAFNVIGYALGAKPASVKNYRDEFDPLFPNGRQGWHNRATRDYCLDAFKQYGDLDLEAFSALIRSFVGDNGSPSLEMPPADESEEGESSFAKRLTTGLAAERYFESVRPRLPEFKDYLLENTTRFGCGYDFRLRSGAHKDFLAVEVKGLRERTGNVAFTPKEYEVAAKLNSRFFLFVVKNFGESPFHEVYQDPLAGELRFKRTERVVIQVSWLAGL